MPLVPGSRVGPYEITAQIGAGGMGIVYLARDPRLGRDVAIKVSGEQFTERFEREARAVAALNHSNICTLHDVGPDYLVMEFVEGETLAELLSRRSPTSPGLPLDEALRLAHQIASALEAAHEKGIVHRDLKPGNIKVKADGTVKVLDFGLAKIKGDDSSADGRNLTNSPTVAIGATQEGLILGTAAYMSPEQARGKPVDKRADIWAFGAVLYEMITGRKAFDGEDASTILAAVIQAEPRWDGVPPQVRRLLKKCLEKDPRRRLRDIGDVWELLDEVPEHPRAQRSGRLGWITAGALGIAAALALWAPWRDTSQPSDKPLVRLDVDLGDAISLVPLGNPTPRSVAISPDGTRLVYVASVSGGPPKLLTRKLDQPRATELAGTQDAANPFFSPDGQWVVFFDGKRLNRISVVGGAAVPLLELGIFTGASWDEDGNVVVGSGLTKGLLRVPSDGRAVAPILELAEGDRFHAMPQLLPGGNAVLVTVYGTPPTVERASIQVVSLQDRSRKTIARGGTSARYLPSGHLVYTNGNTMFAVPFDLDTLETRGTAVPVLDDVAFDAAAGLAQFDVSRDGTLVYRRGSGSGRAAVSVRWLDATGKQEPLQVRPGAYSFPSLSPDGKRLAMVVLEGGSQDVWVYDTERDTMTRLTFGNGSFVSPVWTPDGRFVVFGSIGNGLFSVRADGAGQPRALIQGNKIQFPTSFIPDGTRLSFYEIEGTPQIWTVPIEADGAGLKAGTPERYLSTEFVDLNAVFSPDGRWLAYESNESGRNEVYVRAFPAPPGGQGGRWQISNSGGGSPIWSRDGRDILYRTRDQMWAVSYKVAGDSFVAARPRVWGTLASAQPTPSLVASVATGFDLAPDGKRLIVLAPTTEGAVPTNRILTVPLVPRQEHTVVFLQNFFDELKRRVPTGR